MSDSPGSPLSGTALFGGNASFVEELYEQYLADPQSVEAQWREYFETFTEQPKTPGAGARQGAVSRLIQVYANRGHLIAQLDPLGLMQRPQPRVLELDYFGLSESDLDTDFFTNSHT